MKFMLKKLTLLMAILLMACAFSGCGEKEAVHYDGVINICEKISDEEFILLYHHTITDPETQELINEDTLSKYNLQTKGNEFLFTANALWTSYDNQMMLINDSIAKKSVLSTSVTWERERAYDVERRRAFPPRQKKNSPSRGQNPKVYIDSNERLC